MMHEGLGKKEKESQRERERERSFGMRERIGWTSLVDEKEGEW